MSPTSPETRLFRSHWDDGTLDLVGGVAVVLIGLGYVVEQLAFVGVVLPLAFVAWLGIRRTVVEPRAGYVEFSRAREERSRRELLAVAAVGTGVLMLGFVGLYVARSGHRLDTDLVAGLPALLLAAGGGIAAALTRAWRFAIYGAAFVGAGAATVALGAEPGWPLVVVGLGVWAVGAALLGRFLSATSGLEAARS